MARPFRTCPRRLRRAGAAVAPVMLAAAVACVAACAAGGSAPREPEEVAMAFVLESPAFAGGERIPVRHTCDGEDLSPPLAWRDPPEGTERYVLIADDPDAPVGTWVHWLLYDIPAGTRQLPEGVPPDPEPSPLGGARQGRNDFGRLGYGGPCPPPGRPHRYFFRLYALDRPVALPAGARREALERAMAGHVLGTAELMGTYGR